MTAYPSTFSRTGNRPYYSDGAYQNRSLEKCADYLENSGASKRAKGVVTPQPQTPLGICAQNGKRKCADYLKNSGASKRANIYAGFLYSFILGCLFFKVSFSRDHKNNFLTAHKKNPPPQKGGGFDK